MFSHMIRHLKKQLDADIHNKNSSAFEFSDELVQAHLFEEKSAQSISHSQKNQVEADQNARNAMWYYLRAALRGDKEAQYKMGLSYLNGQLGLDRSYIHAEKWLGQAAHQGHIEAKIELQKALNKLAFS